MDNVFDSSELQAKINKDDLNSKYFQNFTSTGNFFKFIIKKNPLIFLQLLLTIACAAAYSCMPIIIKKLTDITFAFATGSVSAKAMYNVFLLLIFVQLSSVFFSALQNYTGEILKRNIRVTILNSVFAYISNQDADYKESLSSSFFNIYFTDLSKRATKTIDEIVSKTLLDIFSFIILLIIIICHSNWLMRIALLFFSLTLGVIFLKSKEIINYKTKLAITRWNKITNILNNFFTSLDVVNIFLTHNHEKKCLSENISDVKKKEKSFSLSKTLMVFCSEMTFFAMQCLMNFMVLKDIIKGIRAVGDAPVIGNALHKLFSCQQRILSSVSLFEELNGINISLKKIFSKDLLDSYEYAKKQKNLPVKKLLNYDISFKNFSFIQNNGFQIRINDLNIKFGEKYVIVGHSGCGKTTLFRLLMQLYKTDPNMLTIGGYDVNNIPNHELRKVVTFITQNNALISDTLANNIRYSNLEASIDDVKEAVKRTCLENVIERLSNKYDTQMSIENTELSGGEKQRVCLAKVFLSNAKIILLDEATSAIDPPTERELYKNILEYTENKTLLVIAHRLSVLDFIDNVIFMKNGSIFAIGRHKDLLEKYEEYRNFVASDF